MLGMLLYLWALLALSGLVLSSPLLSPHVIHEERRSLPSGWTKTRRHSPDATLSMRFGLAQSNMHRLEEYLLDVAHPNSPNYGKHWMAGTVVQTFSPSGNTVDAVTTWLHGAGIAPSRIRLTSNQAWIELNVTVEEAEYLLGTEYNVYGHDTGAEHVACEKYHLPEHIRPHVDIITPTVHFDVKLSKRGEAAGPRLGQPGFGTTTPKTSGAVQNTPDELDTCDTDITPLCLRALYGIEYQPVATCNNSFGIVEYTPQAYLESDLDMFFANFSPALLGKRPIEENIDGGVVQTMNQSTDYNGESSLDLQYAQALVQDQNLTLYQVGDIVQGASFGNFLDAIDGTYCTFEGGDDKNLDGIYPDPLGGPGAYQGQDCGTVKPANVISTSYSYDEVQLTPAYAARQCAEYAKLGLMGVTVLYSSGDNGVAGYKNQCLTSNGTEAQGEQIFNPGFPGSCPYVTAVGATQLPEGKNVTDPESAVYEMIYSGGGFSNYFAMPSYQEKVVTTYLTNYTPSYDKCLYNSTGTSRGYPDLSANGANFVVAVDGDFYHIFGTSASTPVVGAMITLINDARIFLGKGPVGFINPAIYSHAFGGAFNDITNGTNPGCGTEGFSAVPGWDPVTGLGTPVFTKLMERFLVLP